MNFNAFWVVILAVVMAAIETNGWPNTVLGRKRMNQLRGSSNSVDTRRTSQIAEPVEVAPPLNEKTEKRTLEETIKIGDARNIIPLWKSNLKKKDKDKKKTKRAVAPLDEAPEPVDIAPFEEAKKEEEKENKANAENSKVKKSKNKNDETNKKERERESERVS